MENTPAALLEADTLAAESDKEVAVNVYDAYAARLALAASVTGQTVVVSSIISVVVKVDGGPADADVVRVRISDVYTVTVV